MQLNGSSAAISNSKEKTDTGSAGILRDFVSESQRRCSVWDRRIWRRNYWKIIQMYLPIFLMYCSVVLPLPATSDMALKE